MDTGPKYNYSLFAQTRPTQKKSRRVKFFFCCKISRVPHKILVLQVKSLSRLQQHYKILAGKRLSDTDEIFFDILSIYHYILKPREIGNGRQLFYTVFVCCSQN
jgi:hypothetical protein